MPDNKALNRSRVFRCANIVPRMMLVPRIVSSAPLTTYLFAASRLTRTLSCVSYMSGNQAWTFLDVGDSVLPNIRSATELHKRTSRFPYRQPSLRRCVAVLLPHLRASKTVQLRHCFGILVRKLTSVSLLPPRMRTAMGSLRVDLPCCRHLS